MSEQWDKIRSKRSARESTLLNELATVKATNADLLEALEVARDCLYRTRGTRIELVEATIAKTRT